MNRSNLTINELQERARLHLLDAFGSQSAEKDLEQTSAIELLRLALQLMSLEQADSGAKGMDRPISEEELEKALGKTVEMISLAARQRSLALANLARKQLKELRSLEARNSSEEEHYQAVFDQHLKNLCPKKLLKAILRLNSDSEWHLRSSVARRSVSELERYLKYLLWVTKHIHSYPVQKLMRALREQGGREFSKEVAIIYGLGEFFPLFYQKILEPRLSERKAKERAARKKAEKLKDQQSKSTKREHLEQVVAEAERKGVLERTGASKS